MSARIAAAVLLAAGIGALLLLLTTPSSSVALAEVAEAVKSHQLVRYSQETTSRQQGKPQATVISQTVYRDMRLPRSRVESNFQGRPCVDVWDGAKHRLVRIDHQMKTFTIIHTDSKANRPFFQYFREHCEREGVLKSREELDGRPTIVFRLVGKKEESMKTWTLWTDPKTKLPVRLEREFECGPSVGKVVFSNFEWDPEVADVDALFNLEPPAGYKRVDYPKPSTGKSKPRE